MPNVTSKNVRDVLWINLDTDTNLMTDGSAVYTIPGRMFSSQGVVGHAKGAYVRWAAHTNYAEGFFSQLKRSLDGTYHHVSAPSTSLPCRVRLLLHNAQREGRCSDCGRDQEDDRETVDVPGDGEGGVKVIKQRFVAGFGQFRP